jgi:hypothetical protein
VSFYTTKGWANHKEKYACEALRVRKCGLHPLIHTLLGFNLTQDIGASQRFAGLGSAPPQTGQSFSVGLIIRLTLHLEHLTAWSLTRLILSGSREVVIWPPLDWLSSVGKKCTRI